MTHIFEWLHFVFCCFLGTSKDFGVLPRSLDVVFNHIRGRQYLKMNFKPHLSNEVKKLEDVQVKQEVAIKAAILASLKEVSDQILLVTE